MQGFGMGRYRPYDSDPRKESFNGRTGNHALGKRARKLDDGILIVRFELPFNVWCDACSTHIGQGVRFNAEKTRVGAYFSTPIFRFRCKKTCCQTWMEIETDPKHTRYVVVSGARQQNSEWDPEENGGFAIHDDGKGGSSKDAATTTNNDAFASLEKTVTDKQRAQTRNERLAELEAAASARSADPYTLNVQLRTRFRREKRQRLEREANDEQIRARIGWRSDRPLLLDSPSGESTRIAKQAWDEARDQKAGVGTTKRSTRSLPTSSKPTTTSSSSATAALAARVIANTRRKTDPFRITT